MKKSLCFAVCILIVIALFSCVNECAHVDSDDNGRCDECGVSVDREDGDGEIDGHKHRFSNKVEDSAFIKSAATCTSRARYYYSCDCGAVGTKTFESGNTVSHVFFEDVCTVCGAMQSSPGLVFHASPNATSLTVMGIGSFTGSELVIDTVGDTPVTSIDINAFSGCDNIKSVRIGRNVTKIGDFAFAECNNLESVDIGDRVSTIGEEAFRRTTSLKSITAGEENSNFRSIDGNLYSKNGDTLIVYALGKKETKLVLPDSVLRITAGAFIGCDTVTEIITGKRMSDLKRETIGECINLESLYLSEGIKNIGAGLLTSLKKLKNLTVSENNPNYMSIDGNLYTKNGESFMWYSAVKTDKSFTLPDSVRFIENATFSGCQYLTEVIFGSGVEYIGSSAFYSCKALERVVLNEGLLKISRSAFIYCESLNGVVIPSTVKKIEISAFEGCTSLRSINIPDGVTHLGEQAFKDCSSLTEVGIGSGVTKIENSVFSGCTSLLSVKIPDNVTEIKQASFYGCKSLQEVEIGAGVTQIGLSAFGENTSLESIKIPGNVKKLGSQVFSECTGLKEIILEEGVEFLGSTIFCQCSSLERITLPESLACLEGFAFLECTSLTDVIFKNPYGLEFLNVKGEIPYEEASDSKLMAEYLTDTLKYGGYVIKYKK